MTHEAKKEHYDGLLWGTIMTQCTGGTGSSIIILMPFEVKITLSGVGTSLQGTYELNATPRILSPRAPLQYPGPLDMFPPGSYPAQIPRLDGNPSLVLASSFSVVPVNHKGSVKVEVKGTKMSIELVGVPESTYFNCSAIVDRSAPTGPNFQAMYFPVFAAGEIDLGFFSSSSAIHKPKFELDFSSKAIAYVGRYNLRKERPGPYPVGGVYLGNAEFVVIKSESFYTAVDGSGPRYVEQTGLEEARRLFLENPELLTMMQTEARRKIREGVSEGHVSQGLVKSVLGPQTGDAPGSPSKEAGQTPGAGIEYRKLDEVFLEALKILVKFGGSSNHAMVVSCGWAKFLRIEKGKTLQLDVAGRMYLQSSCKLNESHIETLKEMGLLLDSHSVEIYTTKFDATSEEELVKAARLIEPIFSRVYRRERGHEAYLEMILGIKTPEAEAALNRLATHFPRRDGFKFQFRW